eukprot:TRINITY_DN60977_c0_g1_i1.p1 TRINITY_DN60977_c0_g1~~TRINITY_DN60977_c0_g1_i1.p1  ORF type:complete len:156 (-),score=19.97 TRINITY_DN60977_c0_g1_i1:107-514(-)
MANIRKMRQKYDVIVETPPARIDMDTKAHQEADEVWVFKGTVNNLEAAIDELDSIAEETLKNTACWRAVQVNPRHHRLIIGRGGSRLQDIRKETGCQIVIPRNGSGEEDIIINGPSDDATMAAEDMILDIVDGAR